MHVSTLGRRYSSSRNPYARRWRTRILLIETLDEAELDLVLGPAISGDSIPMAIHRLGELLVRFESLPLQARAPVLEEALYPALALVDPELAEGLP